MKYVILVGDGMADYPIEDLGNKTPLQVANKPNMDELAKKGCSGLLKTIPKGMNPGSDVANLSIFGYNPKKYYTGRGPLEAASLGIKLKNDEVAFRCNFVTVNNNVMVDFSADHITTEESKELINVLNNKIKSGKFYVGVSYRNIFIYPDGKINKLKTTPPHDIVGERIDKYLPKGENSKKIVEIMEKSREILNNHPINKQREKNGKKPANMIWLWGQGKRPKMVPFEKRFNIKGATIAAVDLIKGIGSYLGLKNIEVPGATGYIDTNYKAKGKYAIKALNNYDFVYIHVEAPDEAGHAGDVEEKIKAIENIDSKILGQIIDNVNMEELTIAVLPDHFTPVSVKTHTSEPVPYVLYSPRLKPDDVYSYDEFSAKNGSLGIDKGYNLIKKMMG